MNFINRFSINNIRPTFSYSRMYEEGHGLLQDYAKARKWYELEAEKSGSCKANIG